MTLSDYIITIFGFVFAVDVVFNIHAIFARNKAGKKLLEEASQKSTVLADTLKGEFKKIATSIERMEQNSRLSLQKEGAIRCYSAILIDGIAQRLVMKAANTSEEFNMAMQMEFPTSIMTAIAVLEVVPTKSEVPPFKEEKALPKVIDYVANLEYARERWAKKPWQRGVITQIINNIKNEYAKPSN